MNTTVRKVTARRQVAIYRKVRTHLGTGSPFRKRIRMEQVMTMLAARANRLLSSV